MLEESLRIKQCVYAWFQVFSALSITRVSPNLINKKVTGKSSHFLEFTYGILNEAIAVLITSSVAGSVADVHLAVNIRKVVRSSPRSSKSETPE